MSPGVKSCRACTFSSLPGPCEPAATAPCREVTKKLKSVYQSPLLREGQVTSSIIGINLLINEGKVTSCWDMGKEESRGVIIFMWDFWTRPLVSPTWHSYVLLSVSSSSRSTSFFYWEGQQKSSLYKLCRCGSFRRIVDLRLIFYFYVKVIINTVDIV